ncbi:MAG TPA: hypothetical protein VHO94_01145 [Oscillospiraceae bacterium]|nr:hypothetical protein [Oscillospiraceae bacterium]
MRDIPPGNTPAGIANLYYYYNDGVTEKKRGYVFSATFLELARKGYLTFSEQNEEIGICVSLTEKCKSESRTDLSPNESAFLTLISPVAENKSHSFTMAQFEAYAKDNYELIDNGFDDFLEKSSEEIAQRGYFQTKNVLPSFVSKVGLFFVIAGAIMLFGKTSLTFIAIGAIISGIITIISSWAEQPLTEIGEREYKVWHGLKKYMLDFSRMKEYSVPQLELWEEYLVYATMMGISKQVCEQLKLVYPEINDQNYRDAHWSDSSYLYFMFDFQTDTESGSWDTDLGTILSDRISSIHDEVDTLMNPPSSDSGGGFGGDGGDGFDGGGGGGGGID